MTGFDIFAQILVNGAIYSEHKYKNQTKEDVDKMLSKWAVSEILYDLGRVEIKVHTKEEIDNIFKAILNDVNKEAA